MTTSQSPLRVLKQQAEKVAELLKRAERREPLPPSPYIEKILHAREHHAAVKFAVVMDDKVITIEMAWQQIAETSETALAEYVLKYMRDQREAS